MVLARHINRRGRALLKAWVSALFVVAWTFAAAAQPPGIGPSAAFLPAELAAAVEKQRAEIERLAKSLERVRNNDAELEVLRPQIEAIETAAETSEGELEPLLDDVKRQILALGAKPKDGADKEPPSIAAERSRLDDAEQRLLGALKRSELTRVRARQLIARIQTLRLENLGRNLRQRQRPPPTSIAHWHNLWAALPRLGHQAVTVAENWWALARGGIHWLFLIVVAVSFLWWGLRRALNGRIRNWLRHPLEAAPPAYLMRVRMAVRTLPLLLAPGLVTLGAGYLALTGAGLLNDQIDSMALSALKAIAIYLLVNALAKAILLPSEPSWRLIGLPTTDARRYLWLTRALAGVYCLDLWLNEVFTALQVPTPVAVTETLLANLAFAALLFAFAWLPASVQEEEDADEQRVSSRLLRHTIYWLRVPATLAVLVIALTSLLGYLALGRFIAGQVLFVGIGAAALLLGHLAARSIAEQSQVFGPEMDQALDRHLPLTGRRRSIILSTVAFLLNLVMFGGAIALLLISWGISGAELLGWAKALLFGFEIGTFRFSLLQILLAIALFVAVIVLTRLFQSWLSRKVLSGERVDRGIANSIHAGIGYAGIALAALIGVSYAGVDLSNIALIASALSIGIGFGLNAIASNFVSGLIMLIERPIKVGDWVVVGPHQGYVRHISVRATEIETFDRASVIIPNSDFMTSAVQNWTHRNAMGRVVVNIGVSYDSDPNQIIEILKQVAADCEELLKYPAPSVVFEEFGASSLDFSIRGFIADVNSMLSAKTALRLGIAKALRENGIEIPFPQQDVHLRDLDGVREMVGRAMAQRAEEARRKDRVSSADERNGSD